MLQKPPSLPDGRSSQPASFVLFSSAIDLLQRKVSEAPTHVLITSPYLTSPIAEQIVGTCDPNTCVIITTFRSETFASGASSLDVIRTLITDNYDLRYLDGLHAKVVITADTCFVGSQNLTFGGTKNREATAILTDEANLRNAAREVRGLLNQAKSITAEMVADMEQKIVPLRLLFAEMSARSQQIDEAVRNAEKLRERQRKQEKAHQERLAKQILVNTIKDAYGELQRNARKIPPSRRVRLHLQYIDGGWRGSGHYTLMAPPDADLTTWAEEEDEYTLRKRHRYLLIASDIGKLGWPALNKTRLTHFGVGLEPSDATATVDGRDWWLTRITFNQDLRTLSAWNVEFSIGNRGAFLNLKMRFTLSDFEISDIEQVRGGDKVDSVVHDLNDQYSRLKRLFRETMLSPFRYKSNGLGISAREFCDGLSSDFYLKLRSSGLRRFLSLENIR